MAQNTTSQSEFLDRFVTDLEVSQFTGLSVAKIRKDRLNRVGIPFHKFGDAVRYRLSDVVAWAQSRRVETAA